MRGAGHRASAGATASPWPPPAPRKTVVMAVASTFWGRTADSTIDSSAVLHDDRVGIATDGPIGNDALLRFARVPWKPVVRPH